MEYEVTKEEYNKIILKGAKDLSKTDNPDDWFLFVDMVTRTEEKLYTHTLFKIIDIANSLSQNMSTPKHAINSTTSRMLYGPDYNNSKGEKIYIMQGFVSVLSRIIDLRMYKDGSYRADYSSNS